MKSGKQKLTSLIFVSIACLAVICANGIAHASFDSFVIRNANSSGNPPTIQTNDVYVAGATEFIISEGGMKAGWGSNAINNIQIGQIVSLSITRYDDTSRFSLGSGPAVAPYFNIWVTDGSGKYAVIANEPSNPAFHSLFIANGDGSHTYDLSFSDLSDKVAKVYETPGWNTNNSWVHGLFGPGPFTFSDLSTLEIVPPPPAYIQTPANGVGTGAPDEIGTDIAYGFTWVFGDTLSSYISGDEGYVVASPVAAGPPPTYSCVGFEPPLDNGPVTVKKNKVLPFKAKLLDGDGLSVTNLNPLPVIQVIFDDGVAPAEDVSDDALSTGKGTDGNQFEFDGSKWGFNLSTKNYSASGTYTVTIVSGDISVYDIDPTCEATFVIP